MTGLSSVRRTQYPIHEDDDPPDDNEYDSIRLYYSPEADMPPSPSVSVIKALREDPEKEEALNGWRQHFDGKSSWSRPWYADQKAYKAARGTLVHYTILSELGDGDMGNTYFHRVGDSQWGREEYHAEYVLKKWSKHAPSANTDEISFSPRNNQYDGEHAWGRAVRDMKWSARTFKREIIDGGILDPSNVLDVETYVYDSTYGYGGQFDLLYEDVEGHTVLADLKTSSGVRFDHKLQSAAYKHALEATTDHEVDRCEILRLHPDSEEVEVSSSNDWMRTLHGLENQFLGLVDEAHQVRYRKTLREAELELMDAREKTEQAELASSTD